MRPRETWPFSGGRVPDESAGTKPVPHEQVSLHPKAALTLHRPAVRCYWGVRNAVLDHRNDCAIA